MKLRDKMDPPSAKIPLKTLAQWYFFAPAYRQKQIAPYIRGDTKPMLVFLPIETTKN